MTGNTGGAVVATGFRSCRCRGTRRSKLHRHRAIRRRPNSSAGVAGTGAATLRNNPQRRLAAYAHAASFFHRVAAAAAAAAIAVQVAGDGAAGGRLWRRHGRVADYFAERWCHHSSATMVGFRVATAARRGASTTTGTGTGTGTGIGTGTGTGSRAAPVPITAEDDSSICAVVTDGRVVVRHFLQPSVGVHLGSHGFGTRHEAAAAEGQRQRRRHGRAVAVHGRRPGVNEPHAGAELRRQLLSRRHREPER